VQQNLACDKKRGWATYSSAVNQLGFGSAIALEEVASRATTGSRATARRRCQTRVDWQPHCT